MKALQDIEWLDPLVEERSNPELESWMQENGATHYPHAAYMADCPWILHADVYLDEPYVHITDFADLIYLTVSHDNSCRFCYDAARFLMRLGGMSESEIDRLERDAEAATTEPRLASALDFARRVSRSNPAPGQAEKQALRDSGYDDLGIKEITFHAADVVFHNRVGTLLALPVTAEAFLKDESTFAALREMFATVLEKYSKPAKPEVLAAEHKTGPFTNVVLALDGIAQAGILRTVIDEAWASPHLPTRTKSLIFAVIARGLGSVAAEKEAYRLLGMDGLAAERVDVILAHLAAPELDPVEARILPYVRETIWYQTTAAQRRGRELRAQLTNAQFLETVGIAALANMVCRIPLVLDVD